METIKIRGAVYEGEGDTRKKIGELPIVVFSFPTPADLAAFVAMPCVASEAEAKDLGIRDLKQNMGNDSRQFGIAQFKENGGNLELTKVAMEKFLAEYLQTPPSKRARGPGVNKVLLADRKLMAAFQGGELRAEFMEYGRLKGFTGEPPQPAAAEAYVVALGEQLGWFEKKEA